MITLAATNTIGGVAGTGSVIAYTRDAAWHYHK
jgi:hypothetical protein